jgi:hypothetical protein
LKHKAMYSQTMICLTLLLPERSRHRQTLRDQFAMAALTGQCVDNSNPNVEPTPIQEWDHEYIAKGCYMMADAMLKQREEGRDNEH